jgi:probable rRNA maturation factor
MRQIMNSNELNKMHRGKDEHTNVLSFPQYNADELEVLCRTDCEDEEIQLGDVAISFDRIVQESAEFSASFFERCSHMLVHGALHLIGMDHEEDSDAEKMESAEVDMICSLGIRVPYLVQNDEADHE